MGKRILNIYVEDGDVEIAKSRGINLSSFFRNVLSVEISGEIEGKEEKEIITILKNKIAKLSEELKNKNREIELLKKEEAMNDGIKIIT